MRYFIMALLLSTSLAHAETKEEIGEDICAAAIRVVTNEAKIKHEREIEKITGVVDKEVLYRAGHGVIEGKKAGNFLMREYKDLFGEEFEGDCE